MVRAFVCILNAPRALIISSPLQLPDRYGVSHTQLLASLRFAQRPEDGQGLESYGGAKGALRRRRLD
jgi:hypothetical protein